MRLRRQAVSASSLGELGFGGGGGLILVEELAAVLLVGGGVLGGEDGGTAGGRHSFAPLLYLCSRQRPVGISRFGEAVGEGVLGRGLFAGGGAGAGGESGVGAIYSGAMAGGLVCHKRPPMRLWCAPRRIAWAGGVWVRGVADVVGWDGEMGAGVG